MRTDLSGLFRSGLAASDSWTNQHVRRALQKLVQQHPGSRIDWEPGDEEWGRVIDSSGAVLGLVCARIPVGAARHDLSPRALSDEVAWLRFESMDERSYEIDRELLKQVFGRDLSENVDYASLSLNELWWATVS